MMTIPVFKAEIIWAGPEAAPLEAARGGKLVHPGYFAEGGPEWPTPEGWSVVLTFDEPVAWGDQTSAARARFLVQNAPHERLYAGREFDVYVGTRHLAHVRLGAMAGSVEREGL